MDLITRNGPTQAIEAWTVPNSLLGRLLILGLTVVVFAGEYQWQTWKNIIPRSRRVPLILVKFLAVSRAGDAGVCADVDHLCRGMGRAGQDRRAARMARRSPGEVLADFAAEYLRQAWLAFTLTMISANFAALAGMFTRSILGGVLVGVAFTYIEGLSILGMALLARMSGFFAPD